MLYFSTKVLLYPWGDKKLCSTQVIDITHNQYEGNLVGKKRKVFEVENSSLKELLNISNLNIKHLIASSSSVPWNYNRASSVVEAPLAQPHSSSTRNPSLPTSPP